MAFIDEIKASTEREIALAETERPLPDLKRMIRDAPPLRSFSAALSGGFGMIAEMKRRSPSGGDMRAENFDRAPAAYAASPIVKAVSVLTNASHFGMGMDHLSRVRELVKKPALRKDFILREYQVYQARAFGADAILLMANMLDKTSMQRLFDLAAELGMDALIEVHKKEELASLPRGARICGVNSRNFSAANRWRFIRLLLKLGLAKSAKALDPSVELEAFALLDQIPAGLIKVAESGIRPGNVIQVKEKGCNAILVGTSLMKHPAGVQAALSEFERALSPAQPLSAA